MIKILLCGLILTPLISIALILTSVEYAVNVFLGKKSSFKKLFLFYFIASILVFLGFCLLLYTISINI